MHPCCWGNLLQGLVQLVPVLAIILVGGKKMFATLRQSWPLLGRKAKSEKPCCCPSNSQPESITPVEVELAGPAKV
jgi:hypothetical protein